MATLAQRQRWAGISAAESLRGPETLKVHPEVIEEARRFVFNAIVGRPLVIHSGSIDQRRQLLNAIGNELLAAFPRIKAKRVTMREYFDEMVKANRKHRDGDFIRYYLSRQAVLAEGIEDFKLDGELEDAFFLTMGAVAEKGNWVAMTCAVNPLELEFEGRYARELMAFATRLRVRAP